MNRRDELLQKHFPTIIVPKYEELPACPLFQTRLLMARDGVWLETCQSFGRFRRKCASFQRELPYGDVTPIEEIAEIIKNERVFEILVKEIKPSVAEYAQRGHEWAGWIVWQEGLYYYRDLSIDTTPVSVTINYRPRLRPEEYLVVDVHSHGRIPPFFSATDNNDDTGGVKISLVLGKYDAYPGHFEVKGRIAVEGFYFPLFDDDQIEVII